MSDSNALWAAAAVTYLLIKLTLIGWMLHDGRLDLPDMCEGLTALECDRERARL